MTRTRRTLTRTRQTFRTLLLLLLPYVAGCGGGSTDNVSLPGPDPAALAVSAPTPEGLTAALSQDKSTIPVSKGTVTYTMTLTNTAQSPVAVSVPQDSAGNPLPPVALLVQSTAGDTIYPASLGSPANGSAMQTLTLQPGDFVQQTLQLTNAFRVISRYHATAAFTTNSRQTVVGPLVLTAR